MTIQKAIEVLEYARNYDGMDYGAPSIALDMAISALRQQDAAGKDVGKMTNAQKIRSMTDEELAELIDRETDSCAPTGDCEKMSRDCKACWLEWLQQPAEDDKA